MLTMSYILFTLIFVDINESFAVWVASEVTRDYKKN